MRIQAALGSTHGVFAAYIALMLLAVAAYVNVADSSAAKVSLIIAIPLLSILAVVVGVVRYRPVGRDLWYLVAVAQVLGAVGAGVWHEKLLHWCCFASQKKFWPSARTQLAS